MNENKTLIGRLTFQGETHDIYLGKVGELYGLFVDGERLEDTELRSDRDEAINELVVNYSVAGVYNVELL